MLRISFKLLGYLSQCAVLGGLVQTDSIVLVGHSFGGGAVVAAAAQQLPIRGAVLLDPAVYDTRYWTE